MDLQLRGRIAAVAAASAGLGFATAEELASEGCDLSICARDPSRLAQAAARLRAKGVQVLERRTDVTDQVEVAEWIAETGRRFGRIDVLVTNCGGVRAAPPSDLSPDDFGHAVRQVLLPTISMVTAALPHLRRSSAARIVIVASEAIIRTPKHFALSGVARAGLVPYSRALVQDLAGENVTVNVIAPGAHDTAIHRANREGSHGAQIRAVEDRTPARRLGRPSEFAALAAFLASPRSAYINGTLIPIDGGLAATA